METKLIDYQGRMNTELKKLQAVTSEYRSAGSHVDQAMKGIESLYEHKISNVHPHIMVYGIFNAGKSSIINELIRSDVAKVSDVPTTDTVTKYPWNGYELEDTPGVSAPIQHEKVTMEHLREADVVLFVMSTSGSNEKADNYIRMKDIVDAGKKVIIVLNDKNGDLGKNDENLRAIKLQVAENMRSVGIHDVETKYCIIVVNAKRAHKGRTENKPSLWDKSNMAELERVILSELKNTNSYAVIRNTIVEVETFLKQIIESLEGIDSSEAIKSLNSILDTLRARKADIRKSMNEYIKRKTAKMAKSLPEEIWAKRDNQSAIDSLIKKEIEKIVKSSNQEMESQIRELEEQLKVEIADLVDVLKKATIDSDQSIKVKGVDIGKFIKPVENTSGQYNKEQIEAILQNVKKLHDMLIVNNTKGAIQVPKYESNSANGIMGAAVAVPIANEIAKKVAATTVGKAIAGTALGSFIPYVGPIIAIASILFGGGGDEERQMRAEAQARSDYERRKVEAEMQARQDLQQKCLYMADDIADDLSHAMNDVLQDVIKEFEKVFTVEAENTRSRVSHNAESLASIRSIYNDYDVLRNELRGMQ